MKMALKAGLVVGSLFVGIALGRDVGALILTKIQTSTTSTATPTVA